MGCLLEAELTVDYPGKPRALDQVRFQLSERESLAVLGESGSGKSTLVLAILGLHRWSGARVSGKLRFAGADLLSYSERDWRRIRGKQLASVPQSAVAALNPALRIGTQVEEAWRVHADVKNGWKSRAGELFERVSLPFSDEFLRRFPSQISVGQAQRILIAMALLHRPQLLVSDEPTSAVDPATRDEIRTLLADLSREFGIANLLITHDVATVAGLCSRALVLRQGRVLREVEMADLPFQQADAYARAMNSLYAETTPSDLMDLAAHLKREQTVIELETHDRIAQ